MPKINEAGLHLIENFEGCRLEAYPDPGTGGEPYTIGYGHTGEVNGQPVALGMTITQDTANDLLAADLTHFEEGVNGLVSRDATPNQFAAMVSFAYNEGLGALGGSQILAEFNAGNDQAAADDFSNWTTADGQVLEGLVRRRAAERELFLTP
jgi:lysozyme